MQTGAHSVFLYLSKLLPLFVYPVGIATILILLSVLLRRWRIVSISMAVAAALVLLVFSNGGVAGRMASTLEWQYLPAAELPNADAIVLLGGATRAAVDPRRMTEMNEAGDRLIEAVRLYRDGKAPIIVASGGAIDWLGTSTPEAEGMQQLLEFMDVSPDAIVIDSSARNTYENALYVREIADERGYNSILLVTSAMHMPRSMGIFENRVSLSIRRPLILWQR